ncbi:MAG: DoxX family protein [Deltaproteobacteria bacterium]|nr:DoxX family protein [Deltaproteobacteria bacterium]
MNTIANNERTKQVAAILGRFGLSAIFLMSALGKIFDFQGTQAYMESAGMPLTAFFLVGAILLQTGGGLSLLLGYQVRWGVVALLVFLVPATLIFHAFWAVPPEMQQMQMINFMKNMAIGGALLLSFVHGAGPFSIDAKLMRSQHAGA